MKKTILSGIILTATLVGFGASAVSGDVLTLTASRQEGGRIIFLGSTDDGVLAVSCTLHDGSGKELGFTSVQVEDDAKFEGVFDLVDSSTATTMKCANYDGGNFVTATIDEKEPTPSGGGEEEPVEPGESGEETDDEPVVPKTPDTGAVK